MVAQPVQHVRSARFVSAYLAFWGLMAAGGLTYLGSLAWQTDFLVPPPQTQISEGEQALNIANNTRIELNTVRRTVAEVQRGVGQVKEAVDQQSAKQQEADARISALAERVTTIAASATAPPQPTTKLKSAEKGAAKADRALARSPRIISVAEAAPQAPPASATPPAPEAPEAAPPIETGSIAPSASGTIVFGEPVVTRTTTSSFAVQLGAGPSLDGLRAQWGQLVAQHGDALGSLEPRYVPPRADGGPYRLMAGPLPTRAEADKICAEMGVNRNQCFSTTFIGQRL